VATWSSVGLMVVREIPAVASLNRRRRRGRRMTRSRPWERCMEAILIHRACRIYSSRRKRAFACEKTEHLQHDEPSSRDGFGLINGQRCPVQSLCLAARRSNSQPRNLRHLSAQPNFVRRRSATSSAVKRTASRTRRQCTPHSIPCTGNTVAFKYIPTYRGPLVLIRSND
jgi:hypothetical protein